MTIFECFQIATSICTFFFTYLIWYNLVMIQRLLRGEPLPEEKRQEDVWS